MLEKDDLAQSITETGVSGTPELNSVASAHRRSPVKISTATLKQYHTEYRRHWLTASDILEAAKDLDVQIQNWYVLDDSTECYEGFLRL